MNKNLPYYESDTEVAEYLGMSLPEFLKARADGKIGVTQRPKDATPVWWKSDVEKWISGGKPASWFTSDPSGVSRKVEVKNG